MAFSETTKKYVTFRQKGRCGLCGHNFRSAERTWDFHHIDPQHTSNDDSWENCVMLCSSCHREEAHIDGNTKGNVLERNEYLYLNGRIKNKQHHMGLDKFSSTKSVEQESEGAEIKADPATTNQKPSPNVEKNKAKASEQVGEVLKQSNSTVPNGIYNNNTKTFSVMQRGIDGQIELLNQMKAFLQELQEQFDDINKKQQYFLNGLDGEGIDVKILQRFEEYFEETKQKLNGVVAKISSDDIPYTEQVIRYLEDTPR
jgi:succinate dehydrogenase/fumarate reductase flavoprotein subunit